MKAKSFFEIVKLNKSDNRYSLYIGLNLNGSDVSDLAIPGGENPDDYHVTLLYGYFEPKGDENDTAVRIQTALEEIKDDIPDRVAFLHEQRFEASESSDKKDVIVARAEGGHLEKVHSELLKELKNNGINVETTFPEYIPHMTLAYIEPGAEYKLRELDHSAAVKDISIDVEKKDSKQTKVIHKTFSEILKFNENHDNLGRFSSGSGGASSGGGFTPAKTIDEAKQYATKSLGMSLVDYSNCGGDVKTANMINEQITKIYEKYPDLKGSVEQITSSSTRDSVILDAHLDGVSGIQSINIGTGCQKGYEEMKKKYEDGVNQGFNPKGTTIESAIWHEYGHIYEYEHTDSYEKLSNRETSKQWLDEAREGQDAHAFSGNISVYAQKNSSEAFAEAFAEYNTSKTCRPEAVKMMEASGVYKPEYSQQDLDDLAFLQSLMS